MTDTPIQTPTPSKTFYGRRKGRPLRDAQKNLLETLLPNIEIKAEDQNLSLPNLFPTQKEYRLEIGFGAGEHLGYQAENNPHIGFIGVEPFLNGTVSLLRKIKACNLENLRIYSDDVRPFLKRIPDHVFSAIYILFPDPWPKKRHNKRRLICPEFLEPIARVLKPGGMLRIASDDANYTADIQTVMAANKTFSPLAPENWTSPPQDWATTRYEARGIRLGNTCCYMSYRRENPNKP